MHDLRKEFHKSTSQCDSLFKLMQKNFGFYNELSNDFLSTLGPCVENGSLASYLQNKIRPRLFLPEFCDKIEETKKLYLAEIIKLEQFIQSEEYQNHALVDLNALKDVANAIYELLQSHWELYKYEKQAASHRMLISILQEIDRISINWDSFLERYLAVLELLKETADTPAKEGKSPVKLHYHLPEGTAFTLKTANNLNQFLVIAYEMVSKIHGFEEAEELEVINMEGNSPLDIMIWVPEATAASYSKLLHYLSIDILKKETLVKYVAEIISVTAGSELTKPQLLQFYKKLAKQLDLLPENGYFSVDENEMTDSVTLLADLCTELDRIKVEYNDLLTASSDRAGRNRLLSKEQVSEGTTEDKESTVKINVQNKEHVSFLTS